jgi:hypothetical protein
LTTSGTTDFQLNMIEAIEEAFERCGLEARSGYEMRTARRSINLMMLDWANRGLNMWTYEERTQLLAYGDGEYDLGADIVDVLEQVIQLPDGQSSPSLNRYNLTRVSISTQATRTNPEITGRPTEVYYNRGTAGITAHIWPLPGDGGPYTLVVWVLRRIEDAGAFTNTGDFPFRFLPVFVAGLAYYVAQKKRRDDPNLVQTLKGEYDEAWANAASEDREKATLTIVPRSSSYRVAG